jgi:hypothetical protein
MNPIEMARGLEERERGRTGQDCVGVVDKTNEGPNVVKMSPKKAMARMVCRTDRTA